MTSIASVNAFRSSGSPSTSRKCSSRVTIWSTMLLRLGICRVSLMLPSPPSCRLPVRHRWPRIRGAVESRNPPTSSRPALRPCAYRSGHIPCSVVLRGSGYVVSVRRSWLNLSQFPNALGWLVVRKLHGAQLALIGVADFRDVDLDLAVVQGEIAPDRDADVGLV